MSIATIKQNIKTLLDQLVTAEVLASCSVSDLRTNPLNTDIGTWPHAFLMTPSVASEALDNRNNTRTYIFDIAIIFNAQNITDSDEVETTIEAVLDKFDNNPTLLGSALGGMLPVSSTPEPYQHGTQELILVVVRIEAKETVSLTFS